MTGKCTAQNELVTISMARWSLLRTSHSRASLASVYAQERRWLTISPSGMTIDLTGIVLSSVGEIDLVER